ncbi:cobalt-precorrin-6A reductase [Aliiruegeria sabulilitoris]|uniref:cobalt-precorrin-6A reductase n=1 Tax=Aliiruegeria sabulilitoris TaxID=1510458 RepID=UPI00082E2811|nr:cobalt-precorrin-6A reductase [Aliiruegeria sabulilitoris]NDR59244.1 cobalt-precorrin-6A reductase [Pseudoruegeria sp. M32A2M]
MSKPHILLLAGTAEARHLAEPLSGRPVRLTVSLAGATRRPARYPGEVRMGGFGGEDGLAEWLIKEDVSLLLDATHPYAEQISENAFRAAKRKDCPLLRFTRPAWEPEEGENWQPHPTLAAAIAALPAGARAFLATGSGSREAVEIRSDLSLILRAIEPLDDLPDHVEALIARPPFSEAQERELMKSRAVTHLVTRNSGGGGRAKLAAAASLGLPILMIERPKTPGTAPSFHDIAEILRAVAAWLALDTPSGSPP